MSAPKSISQPQCRLLSHSFLRRTGSLTFLSSAESAPRKLLPSATAALRVFQPFRNCGRRHPFQSEAQAIRHPQRRAGDFANPSAMANSHFANSSDRRLQQLECQTSDQSHNVGRRRNLGSDAGLLSHPQRRTGDFTKPSATADAHFLQWPDRSILSHIFEIFLRHR